MPCYGREVSSTAAGSGEETRHTTKSSVSEAPSKDTFIWILLTAEGIGRVAGGSKRSTRARSSDSKRDNERRGGLAFWSGKKLFCPANCEFGTVK